MHFHTCPSNGGFVLVPRTDGTHTSVFLRGVAMLVKEEPTNNIRNIKLVRAMHGIGLREAKHIVDMVVALRSIINDLQ